MIRAIRTSISNIEAEIDHLDREIEQRMQPFEGHGRDISQRTSCGDRRGYGGVPHSRASHILGRTCSWQQRECRQKKSTHTNHGNKATKAIMTECAWCATRTKGTYFSARYKRLAARRGKKRALVAIAAEMLKVVYHMLKDGTAYQELGEDYMVSRRKDAQIKYHREQLNKLLGEDSPETQSA